MASNWSDVLSGGGRQLLTLIGRSLSHLGFVRGALRSSCCESETDDPLTTIVLFRDRPYGR